MPPAASSVAIGDRALALHPQAAVRPEPFGALAYHYDTRRLVFLKHPDLVRVVQSLAGHPTVDDTLAACEIDDASRPAFRRALASLADAGIVGDRAR